MHKPENLDQYLATLTDEQRTHFDALFNLVAAAAPTATVKISWGMPVFEFVGDLVGICAFKKHISLFPMGSQRLVTIEKDVEPFRTSKGTLQFPYGEKLPAALIKKIVKLRAADNIAAANRPPLKDGLAHGKSTEYYPTGTIKATGAFRKGELHGEWHWYRTDGSLMRHGYFKDGVQTGEWSTHDRDGKLVKTTVIKGA